MANYEGTTNVTQGTLGVDDVLADKHVIDMSPELHQRYSNIDPIFKIFSALAAGRAKSGSPVNLDPDKMKAMNYKVQWIRSEHIQRHWYLTTNVAESASAGATVTLIPSATKGGSINTNGFVVGDVVKVNTGTMNNTHTNMGVVTAVSAGVSITVDPIGYASNDSSTDKKFTNTVVDQKIEWLHNASEEYSRSPVAKSDKDSNEWNYIHFQRLPFVVGNIEMDMKQHTGFEMDERAAKAWREIRISAEKALIWGERYKISSGAGGNGVQLFMRGIWEYIRNGNGEKWENWTAGANESDLDEYLVNGPCRAGYGSDTRLWFQSSSLYLKTTELMKKKVGNLPEKKHFGLTFEKYTAPGGKQVLIRQHGLFTDDHEGEGLIVDPSDILIRPYGRNGAIRRLTNLQERDRAGRKDEYQTIFTLQASRDETSSYQTP